jgi:AraC family transcriptional regulator
MQSNHNRQQYNARIRKVLDFINSHLDQRLSLRQLSDVANFSPFHFHRQFTAYTGVPLNRMILLMRLKQAAQALGTNSLIRVLDVAQQAGLGTFCRKQKAPTRH